MAVRGDEPLKIMQRAGHAAFATTQLYVRTAEALREGFGVPFPPLPRAHLTLGRVSDLSETPPAFQPKTSPSGLRLLDSNQRPGG